MLQDIFPHQFHNEYKNKIPDHNSYILYFFDDCILLKEIHSILSIPTYKELESLIPLNSLSCNYLFSIDNSDYFLYQAAHSPDLSNTPFCYHNTNIFRNIKPLYMAFAGITGTQLYHFYKTRRYCGCCKEQMQKSKTERALICPSCHHIEYPKISPAIIVGIINHNSILLTKYKDREYSKFALVAGFTEIGETLEQTVSREVMEEVGLKVKNITYYKSQPWPFSDSLLVGFFAELDGSPQIRLDQNELSTAIWTEKKDIPNYNSSISLTHEMIMHFRNHM